VRPLVRGSRTLWVGDNPGNNLYERTVLASLGVSVDLALSTEEAHYMTARLKYDLVLSDMKRGSNPTAGRELLDQLRLRKRATPVVFYTGHVDLEQPAPIGGFGITDRPDALLHYFFDVLERRASEAGSG
jgi:CheY-like chemotaxis protein